MSIKRIEDIGAILDNDNYSNNFFEINDKS